MKIEKLNTIDKYASEKGMIKSIFTIMCTVTAVTAEMRNNDVVINHKTVQRPMVCDGLKSQIRKVRYRS